LDRSAVSPVPRQTGGGTWVAVPAGAVSLQPRHAACGGRDLPPQRRRRLHRSFRARAIRHGPL